MAVVLVLEMGSCLVMLKVLKLVSKLVTLDSSLTHDV